MTIDCSALPLIALPGTSPVNEEKTDDRDDGGRPATLSIGETVDESVLLPACGEKMPAGR
jgi:hypothetical protein